MNDRKFYINKGPYNLAQIAELIGAEISSEQASIKIHNVESLKEAGDKDITFLSNNKYLKELKKSKAAAYIVAKDIGLEDSKMILLKVDNPYHSYNKLLDMFYSPAKPKKSEIMPSAYIAKSAKIGQNCYIGHNVVIEEEVEIGDNTIIESGSFIDFRVKIGGNTRIDSNVSISHAVIGDDVVVLPGARIGQDGFGFSTDSGVHKKIYHTGRVVIGNNVEIGANSCIDRGSMNDTIIEDMCRVDNLVQIGHNVHIKRGAVVVSQAGVAGSSSIGSYAVLGGQVGISGHINIADMVQIAAKSGVIKDIEEKGQVFAGYPAIPVREWHKQTVTIKKLIKK